MNTYSILITWTTGNGDNTVLNINNVIVDDSTASYIKSAVEQAFNDIINLPEDAIITVEQKINNEIVAEMSFTISKDQLILQFDKESFSQFVDSLKPQIKISQEVADKIKDFIQSLVG